MEEYATKKQTYNIKTRDGMKTVSGYTYELGGIRFGFTRTGPDGKDLGAWNAVELWTGLLVTYGQNTMRRAIADVQGKYLDRVRASLEYYRRSGQDANPGIVPTYTVWTAKNAQTIHPFD